ncbi:MAG: hypothetical protein AAF950_03520 [Pseudomonadota bacterium]
MSFLNAILVLIGGAAAVGAVYLGQPLILLALFLASGGYFAFFWTRYSRKARDDDWE